MKAERTPPRATVTEAEAIRVKFDAIHEGNPTSDLLAIRYLEILTKMADGQATKIIVPTEFSGVLGAVAGIAGVMSNDPNP
jgi:regulator of protease activity HflC (stomatin/prohibitin superfamily)